MWKLRSRTLVGLLSLSTVACGGSGPGLKSSSQKRAADFSAVNEQQRANDSVTTLPPAVLQTSVPILLPVAQLKFESAEGKRSCFLGYLGDGVGVTAGHCMGFAAPVGGDAALQSTEPCGDAVEVRWLTLSDAHVIRADNKVSTCTDYVNVFSGSDPQMDVAFLFFSDGASNDLPRKSIVLQSPVNLGPNPNIQIVAPGLETEFASGSFPLFKGYAFQTANVLLMHNTDHLAGMSGSPLFLQSTNMTQESRWAALGIHLGRGSGGNRALSGARVKEYLDQAKKLFSGDVQAEVQDDL